MTVLRPQLHGLVSKLALFYVLLSLPTLVVVESVILIHEFRQFMGGLAGGSLDHAAERGASDLAAQWPHLRGTGGTDTAALGMWLDAWVLRLQQPRGGLTPDESYVLLELADVPLAAAVIAPDGNELARSHGDGHWTPEVPQPDEAARAAAAPGMTAIALPGSESPYKIRRTIAPLRSASGEPLGYLFVELRVPLPWQRLLFDSSFESPTVLGFLIVFGLASSIFLAGWVTRRLNRIARAASAWSRGDFSDRIGDTSHDELGHVSALLDRMAIDLKGLLRSRAQLATLAERQRLARDLHDTVKQKAFALNLQLATARRVLADTPGAERLEQAQRLTQQIQQELAQILDEMRASDRGAAIRGTRAHARERVVAYEQHGGRLSISTMCHRSPRRSRNRCCASSTRRSRTCCAIAAPRMSTSRSAARRSACGSRSPIMVAARRVSTAPGMGLRNMRERAQALPGGRFALDARPDRGTRVTVSFLAEGPTR